MGELGGKHMTPCSATDAFVDWSKLNSSLYAVMFLAQSNGRGRCCQYCLESDYVGQECTLAPYHQPECLQRSGGWGPTVGVWLGEGHNNLPRSPFRTRMASQQWPDRVCYAWNDGMMGTASSQPAATRMSVPSAKLPHIYVFIS